MRFEAPWPEAIDRVPQWFRDRAADPQKYPDERSHADAPVAMAALLRRYDHHVVRVDGRPALLLTYHWDLEAQTGNATRRVAVSFTYPNGHPAAPPEVQAVIDTLAFTR